MKLQKLIIHNIASIEDAEIDFDAEPLATSEVFLITGKTGSGKTTILDAICLALYAETPRLYNTNMQGRINDGSQEIGIKETRQLLRKNTGEAFVTLTFISNNNTHYEATWAVSRSRKKADGNLQTRVWQLRNLDDDTLLTKEADIQREILLAVGLDFNQFCRTTMLAQGEFTKFLNSKNEEKSAILEKITGVDIYSKIGAKIYELTTEQKRLLDEAKIRVEGIRTLTEEEITEQREKLDRLNAQYDERRQLLDAEKAKLRWLSTYAELQVAIRNAINSHTTALNTINNDKFKQTESFVNLWKATIEPREWLRVVRNAEKNISQINDTLAQLQTQYINLLGGFEYESRQLTQAENDIKAITRYLEHQQPYADLYENSQTIIQLLSSYSACIKFIEERQLIIKQHSNTLNTNIQPALRQAQSDYDKAKDELSELQNQTQTKEKDVETLQLPQLRQQADSLTQQLNDITIAQERNEALHNAVEQLQQKKNNLTALRQTLDSKKQQLDKLNEQVAQALTKYNTCREILDQQKQTISDFAQHMRLHLQIGEQCPICGQTVINLDTVPHEDVLKQLVKQQEHNCHQAEDLYRQLNNQLYTLNAELQIARNNYQRDQNDITNDQTVSSAQNKLNQALSEVKRYHSSYQFNADTLTDDIQRLHTATQQRLIDARKKIQQGEQQEQQLRQLRRLQDTKHKETDRLQQALQLAEKKVSEYNNFIQSTNQLIENKIGEQQETEKRLNSLISRKPIVENVSERSQTFSTIERSQTFSTIERSEALPTSQRSGKLDVNGRDVSTDFINIDWNKQPTEYSARLSFAAKEYTAKKQELQQLELLLTTKKTTLNNIRHTTDTIMQLLPDWRDLQPQQIVPITQLQNTADQLYNRIIRLNAQLTTLSDTLQQNRQRLNLYIDDSTHPTLEYLERLNTYSHDTIRQAEQRIADAKAKEIEAKAKLAATESRCSEHEKSKPRMTDEDTEPLISQRISDLEVLISQTEQSKGAIRQVLQTNEENIVQLGALSADAQQKEEKYNQWARLNQLLGSADGKTFRTIAQSYVLADLIHSANAYMRTLNSRYTLTVCPGTFIIMLEDAYQGYAQRAATTLSGGETFLVSLALALALSDIGQQLSVDTLFIDEGFGTLSGEPLLNAIQTLRTLHNTAGRHVGIISHIEELREQIPVQIQVIQEGNNSASTINITS